MASEYSTGMICSSLLAVPKLAAKGVVFAVLVFLIGELVAFPSFVLGAVILHSKAPVALGDPGVLPAIIGAGLYLGVLGLFALAIGALVRHVAGAITGIIGFVLVLSPLAQLLPGSLGKHVHAYLPTEAGHLIAQAHQDTHDLLTPGRASACSACGPRSCSHRLGLPPQPPRRLATSSPHHIRNARPSCRFWSVHVDPRDAHTR